MLIHFVLYMMKHLIIYFGVVLIQFVFGQISVPLLWLKNKKAAKCV